MMEDEFIYKFMLYLIKYLLQALIYVHSNDIVHADIKPQKTIVIQIMKL